MFEEAILNNNPEQIAKLWGPAGKAHDSPDTGIEVLKKSAYYVIRDCAKVARLYLPIHVWELYDDPVTSLKGKFTKVDVEDFLNRSNSEPETKALKKVILADIKIKHIYAEPSPVLHLISTTFGSSIINTLINGSTQILSYSIP